MAIRDSLEGTRCLIASLESPRALLAPIDLRLNKLELKELPPKAMMPLCESDISLIPFSTTWLTLVLKDRFVI